MGVGFVYIYFSKEDIQIVKKHVKRCSAYESLGNANLKHSETPFQTHWDGYSKKIQNDKC